MCFLTVSGGKKKKRMMEGGERGGNVRTYRLDHSLKVCHHSACGEHIETAGTT